MPEETVLPRHVGIIMDGNGRWAKKRGLPRSVGHKFGASTLKRIARYCNKIGIPYLTVYAFSTENWKRPKAEIDSIFQLFREFLNDVDSYTKENIKVRFIGDRSPFSDELRQKMVECEQKSENHTGMILNMALNYGSQDELAHAMQTIAEDVKNGRILPQNVTKELISDRLYTAGQPDVDLVIRPSGEKRLSNFMLWQAAYAEFVFMDVLWPDFKEKQMDEALKEFANRERRYGGI